MDQGKQKLTVEHKATDFPLDHYLEFEKKKHKPVFEQQEQTEPFSQTEKLIRQINDLATEAEEKVKACIYNRDVKQSPVFSPVSLDESDSGYTEHLVEAKFNEVTFQKPKGIEKLQQEIRKDQTSPLNRSFINKSNNNPAKYGRETYRSTAETKSISPIPSKYTSRKKFSTSKNNPHYIPKNSSIINPENKRFRKDLSEAIYPKTTCHYCSCTKGSDIENSLKHTKDTSKKERCQYEDYKLLINHNNGQATSQEKQFNDASVNTDPLLVKPNTNLVNVVSLKEEKIINMNDYTNKLCQIQELPQVVIRPNFTKQVGPVIDIKTTRPLSPKNNVAVVECIHGGTIVGAKRNSSINVSHESSTDTVSQAVSPPAVHFKNSRDLKLLKATKDLLGKLNFKDGINVERLKRSLTNLVNLLNQISPIHVANLRLSNLDSGSASESIDTFFSNIDLVTEIIENEIKKPTGRYCDYPECLIKAVDLLCGNIRSVFVIEDIRKKTSKPCVTSGPGEEKKVKKSLASRVRKQEAEISLRPSSVTSSIDIHEKGGNIFENSKGNIPQDLYIPYRLLIPGGKHKAMEEAKNSQDIELRFKRLEKVLEINKNLKKAAPSTEILQTDKSVQSHIDEDKSVSTKEAHALNETFVIKSASDDDKESEIIQAKLETKVNKTEQDYEDDWEVDSSKSNDGSMAMTEIKVVAQVHSSGRQSSIAHSSPKKLFLPDQLLRELSVSSEGSENCNLESASDSFSRTSQSALKDKESKDTKRQSRQIPVKRKIHGELKDVETQYYVSKRDIATMYCEDTTQSQKPKVEIIEPITIPPEVGSFTVLRMTNASTNSLLEVRFPEQTEKLQSSLTVQKTHNSEEVKLLYNLDKEETISQQDDNVNGLKTIPSEKTVGKSEVFQTNASNSIENAVPKCGRSKDDRSSLQKKELNDFQHITTNFIQFLENKVTEMVNKFKTSEVTCEKLLDQKLANRSEHKASRTSVNNIRISSSKTSLQNEVFYKSASSVISNQSNEDFGNWLSHRCTPDNQEIIPFENLTSPPLGLQLKDSNALKEASESKNKDSKQNLGNNGNSALPEIHCNLEKENQNRMSDNNVLDKCNDLIRGEIADHLKFMFKEKENNVMPIVDGLHNRLLPLPEDINYNRDRNSNEEREKVCFRSAKQMNDAAEVNGTVVSYDKKNSPTLEIVQTPYLKSNGTTIMQEVDISQKSGLFEDVMLALVNVEQTFGNTNDYEDSTVIVAKTPPILSKSEDELDSQRTSISNFANILSATESINKNQYQNKILPSNANVPSESKIDHQEQRSNVSQIISKETDFSKLLPIPEQIEKLRPDIIKFSNIEAPTISNASVHSLFVRGPSHVDKGLKSSDSFFRKTDDSAVLIPESKSINTTSQVPPPHSNRSSNENVDNLTFDNLSYPSTPTKSDVSVDNVSLKPTPQLLPLHPNNENNKTTGTKILDNGTQTSFPVEDIHTTCHLALSNEDISELSDDCVKLNFFNPEEMSDGEVGYMYTSNSYSSGEIKPYIEQNEDDSLTGPPTFREITHHFEMAPTDHACGEPNLLNNTSENKINVKSSIIETGTSVKESVLRKVVENSCLKSEKTQENVFVDDLLNSSNDSTSTGELKNLFTTEDKIDEGLLGKLIDIHVHCSTRFSSESSGRAESVESRRSREEDI